MPEQKQNLIVARLGGGIEPDLIMQCDVRITETKTRRILKRFFIVKIIEFKCNGNARLFNEKIIDLHTKLILSEENNSITWPVKTIIDCSENITYEPPVFDWQYSVDLINVVQSGLWDSDISKDSSIMKTSRPILMNKVKPHLDLSLEDGQKARVVFVDDGELAKDMKASMKSIVLKPRVKVSDDSIVQAHNRKEALSLMLCIGIYEASKGLGFSGQFEQPNIPVI